MRENKEDWGKQLQTVIIEIAGMQEIFYTYPAFLQLLCKLEGLNMISLNFETYRKTVFEALNLIQELKGDIQNE